MDPVKRSDSEGQMDRLEGKVDQVLDRLTRMEVRQDSQGARIESHDSALDEHAQRIREIELNHAVAKAITGKDSNQLQGRWAALGGTALVILGAIGSFIGSVIIKIFHQ